jgi:hypothetical protein
MIYLGCKTGVAEMNGADWMLFVATNIEASSNHLATEAIDVGRHLGRQTGVLCEKLEHLQTGSDNLVVRS